eukprot:6172155-Pleurochrysis_carterae.AAC.2
MKIAESIMRAKSKKGIKVLLIAGEFVCAALRGGMLVDPRSIEDADVVHVPVNFVVVEAVADNESIGDAAARQLRDTYVQEIFQTLKAAGDVRDEYSKTDGHPNQQPGVSSSLNIISSRVYLTNILRQPRACV